MIVYKRCVINLIAGVIVFKLLYTVPYINTRVVTMKIRHCAINS